MELTWKKQRRRVFWVEGTACVKSRGERGLGELKRSLVSMCGSEGGKWRGERERVGGTQKKGKDEELRMEHWVFKVGSSQECTPCSVSLWWVWKLRKIVPPRCLVSTNNPSGFLSCCLVKLNCSLAKVGKCSLQKTPPNGGCPTWFPGRCVLWLGPEHPLCLGREVI